MDLKSIWIIIKQTIKLFIKSYIDIFPFALCYVFCIHIIDKFVVTSFYLLFFKNLTILLLTVFFFSCILYGQDQRYYDRTFNYAKIILRGIKRFLPALASYLIILCPAFLIGLLLKTASNYVFPSTEAYEFHPNLETSLGTFLMLVITIAMIGWLVFVLYFYFNIYFIVIKEHSALKGLKDSWELIHGHWLKTFCLLLILILTMALLHYSFISTISKFAKEIVSLIITPLSGALMVSYYHYLSTTRS